MMRTDSSIRRITLLSFRTFGDYVLKAPFLHELFLHYPDAQVTLLTNEKGGQVYPLLDSRLNVVVVDHGNSKAQLLRKLWRIPRADILYAIDDSRTTLILALLLRGKQKTGWVQGLSRLYSKDGYFEWKSVRPWLSAITKLVFRPARIRRPEDSYEGDVELELLDEFLDEFLDKFPDELPDGRRNASGPRRPLASYRSPFALPPAARPESPYIYCAAEAGWVARQLTAKQWEGIITGLLNAFPRHSVVVHGAAHSGGIGMMDRVTLYSGKSIRQLFEEISAADLVIAPDSFALHLASLYNVPAVGYFGPAHPHRFRPTGPRSASLFNPPECSPCLQMRGTTPCAKGLTQCVSLAQLSPEDFLAAAKTALVSSSASGADAYAHRSADS
jgi:ADP-heptose:LPS heptosyltransferase